MFHYANILITFSIPATSPGQHRMAEKCRELEEDLRSVVEVAQRNLPNPHPTIERIAEKYLVNSVDDPPLPRKDDEHR